MKFNTTILALTFVAASLLTGKVYSQPSAQMNMAQLDHKDSVETATRNEANIQQAKDENAMTNAKADRKDTKAKAKEAKRIEREANYAANESRYAVRAERKAQRSRRQANNQAEKASKAREKSDNN
jgi:hypothetical protein